MPLVAVAFEFDFHGGSMGYAVARKFTRAAQLALEEDAPGLFFRLRWRAHAGGADIADADGEDQCRHRAHETEPRVPYISVMTDPDLRRAFSASLALLGDINIAEPDARAGFAGPNIIEQTIRQKLPKGFQRSEFLLEHGAIDMIVHRTEMRDTLGRLLAKLGNVEMQAEPAAEEEPVAVEEPAPEEPETEQPSEGDE